MMISTGLYATADSWADGRYTRKAANSKARNAAAHSLLSKVETLLLRLDAEGKLQCMSDRQVRRAVELEVNGKAQGSLTLLEAIDEYIARKVWTDGTRTVYTTTRNKIAAYDARCPLSAVDKRWLEDFDRSMAATMKTNAKAIHLRNLRAVCNYAIDEGYITVYPFRHFTIRQEATRKRSLSADELRALADYPCKPQQRRYVDMFMLMFYLMGINAADLFLARPGQLHHGRLEYRRAKTGRLYSVKVEPEAMAIVNRYRGDAYLLNVMDTYGDYRDFLHRMNTNLKQVGEERRVGRGGRIVRRPLFPDLSSYWSRHTWATIAAEMGVPMETIAAALGHSTGFTTTEIYVRSSPAKVDAANRRVIDAVCKSCANREKGSVRPQPKSDKSAMSDFSLQAVCKKKIEHL